MERREMISILKLVKYRDWKLFIDEPLPHEMHPHHFTGLRCHWEFYDVDATGKQDGKIKLVMPVGFLHAQYDQRTILEILRISIHDGERHEADEFFRFDGVAIFDPHKERQ